ncbi:MAG: LamG domain-containing protein [Burkholderiales bacterium]
MKDRQFLGAVFATLMAGGAMAATPTDGLIGQWKADGNANDASVHANHGSFSGSFAEGVSGQAFDLSTGVVSVPDNVAYAVGSAFTVAFWFNDNNRGHGIAFLGQDEGPGNIPKWFIDYGYTGAHFEIHANGPWRDFLPSAPVSLAASGWNHLALTVSENTYRFYLNGAALGQGTFPSPLPDPAAPLRFGDVEGISTRALMDEIVFYNRALSAGEIGSLAAIPEPRTEALLAGGLCAVLVTVRRRRARSPGRG